RIDVDYLNADQRPDAFFADLDATLEARRRVYLELLREEAWDLFIGVITECDRLHHYFWSQYADPAAPLHGRFLDFYRRLPDVLRALLDALPARPPPHPPWVLPDRVAAQRGSPRADRRQAEGVGRPRPVLQGLHSRPGPYLRAPAGPLPARDGRPGGGGGTPRPGARGAPRVARR